MTNKKMWTAIHYDRRNNLMFLWTADGARSGYKIKNRCFTSRLGEYGSRPCGMKDIYGNDVYEIIADSKTESDIKQRHFGPNNHISECDIDVRTRWLQSEYREMDDIRFSIEDFNICFLDIEVAALGKFPKPSEAEFPINVVTIYFTKYKKYYTFLLEKNISDNAMKELETENCEIILCKNEAQLLFKLFTTIRENETDILTGWHSHGFDFPYIYNRAEQLGVDIKLLSRLPEKYRSVYIDKRDGGLNIAGTEVIDFLLLYRKFGRSERDNYKLDNIGKIEVGESKAPLPDGYQSYKKYWDDWVLYNFQDVRLMVKIEAKIRLFETTIGACSEARVPFSAIFESKKMLVGFMLNYMHKKNIVFPPLKDKEREEFPGAYVYSTPGYYECLVSYDYRSMYPSIMMGANISPETKVTYPIDEVIPDDILETLVRSPWTANMTKQVFYRRDQVGIVPEVVRILFDGRTALKILMQKCEKEAQSADAAYYDIKQNTYKLFGNALYGLLGTPYFQFYDVDNSASVTAFGQELIQFTIKELVTYIEGEFRTSEIYKSSFGEYPRIDQALVGSFYNDENELCQNRLSHGDTDSFFVKFKDIYGVYADKKGKKIGLVFIEDRVIVGEEEIDLDPTNEQSYEAMFRANCARVGGADWENMDDEKRDKAVFDGQYITNNKKTRIILNRYTLTCFCRILDAILLEEKLASIMKQYADKWNYFENTLFLKREKCVLQSIVTAKKKYICYVESNEDARFSKLKFTVTGLEIVRSSTSPFSRKHLQDLVIYLLNTMNKKSVRTRYLQIKTEFYNAIENQEYYDISIPSGIKTDPPRYLDYVNYDDQAKKDVDWRIRNAMVWNHLVDNDPVMKLMALEPIFGGSKVKFIKVKPNRYNIKSIAYIGDKCPERIFEIFTPYWEEQWVKSFAQTIDRLFVAIGWGSDLEHDQRDSMMELI